MEDKKMERMKELVAQLNAASKAYYAEDRATITNGDEDRL